MNKKFDIGLIALLAIGLFLIRGIVNIDINKAPIEDKMADIINNGVQSDYYYNIKADRINEKYTDFSQYGWEQFYILKDLPGSEKSDNINVVKDYYYVDYGTFEKHRTRFFQNRTGDEITEDAFCMNFCQKWETSQFRDTLYITENGTEYKIKLLDFYNKDTKEFVKTVTFIWWHQDENSFFMESDYSFDELLPFIKDMDIIKAEKPTFSKGTSSAYAPLPPN
ncbi:MAG: hypothetical protein IKJ68_13495 [Clostridia bacterium]|nr:hypothetical protein [Oscillospiraceae bacterium]MBR3934905.1 hypothetical protein [Clostridia bacterium]